MFQLLPSRAVSREFMHILPRWRKTAEKMLSGGRRKSPRHPSRDKLGELWLCLKDAGSSKGRPGFLPFLYLGILPESHNVGGPWGAPSGTLLQGIILKLISEVRGTE